MTQITLVNGTDELVRIAVYKKPAKQPTLDALAWQVVAPPPGGQTVVHIPLSYQIYAEYSSDPNAPDPTLPDATVNQTNILEFAETTARFQLRSIDSQDRKASGAYVHQAFNDMVANEVRFENNFGQGVLSHIQKDNVDIFPPQVLWPGAVRMEDLRSSLYLAVVGQFVYRGNLIVDEEVSMTETEILEGASALITGSKWKGYSIVTSMD